MNDSQLPNNVVATVGGIQPTNMKVKVLPSHVSNQYKKGERSSNVETKSMTRPIVATDFEKGHKERCKNSWQEDYTKLHNNLLETNQNKFVVVSCSKAGWGNRLRVLLCVFHFAVITKRAIIIDCKRPTPLDKYLPPRHVRWNYSVSYNGLSIRRGYRVNLHEIKNINDPKLLKMLNYSVEFNPALRGGPYIELANLLPYDLPSWPNVNQMMGCDFYYLFKKSDVLENRLQELKAKLGFNDNIVLGIHVREGDSVFHHNQRDKRFKSNNDIQTVFDCATKIEKEINERYNTSKVIWFLAADSDKLRSDTKEKYGNKVKYVDGPIEHIGHPTKGNEDVGQLTMLLDFFLLQQSDFKLYTSPSTFDSAIDYISLGKRNIIRLRHRGQPSCKLPQL